MPETLFAKILVPVDFSACAEEAFRVACALARVFSSEVLLLHVVDARSLEALNRLGLALPSEEKEQKRRLNHHARATMRRMLAAEAAKGLPVRRVVKEGAPFVEIARLARSEKVQLVVMGSYGAQAGNVEKIFFGSTAEKVVRTAGCPVLTVPLPGKLPAGKGTTT
jgi:nucleotide-binding universal stress UspA family protein